MTVKVGVNGFGRIGRLVLRALLEMEEKIDIVAINDIAPNEALAHMFEFDSIHGHFGGTVEVTDEALFFNGDEFVALSEKNPADLPWDEFDTDIVIECTGRFRTREDLSKHIDAGAKRVILSAPAKNGAEVDLTVVKGVNDNLLDVKNQILISNASCTTNCLAPVVKVLDDNFGFAFGTMTTIHSYTNDQRLLDSIHTDFRRMRAAGINMFPTTTGASKAIGLVLPKLAGKIDGVALRVPIPNVAIVDLTARLESELSMDQLKEAYIKAAEGEMKDILGYETRPLVSSDYNHNPLSAIVDFPAMKMVDDCMPKIMAWYDNEWGYANRVAELVHDVYSNGNVDGVF
ncbi:MAG: Glyceraldehyde-3-phosphate dehydrogenase [Candidatus Heimdallarchaeota archaeon LC_2]|nr:MAG: Glyceraldehyde-3-phosphate dehydrogenase [Candidatus Heimdallarchaeota archaeon LC_2]